MEPTEAPQAPERPSLLVGSIWVAVVCAGVFAYNVLRSDVGAGTSYAIGEGIGGGLVLWVIFHFAIAKRRGWEFSGAALGFILAAAAVGSAVNVKAKENREQMAAMRDSMRKEIDAVARSVQEAKPTARIDTTPTAGGEVGEMERFGRTFLSRMAELRNDYLRQLDSIGWDGILDAKRIAADKGLVHSRQMVGKARALVASYKEKALATIESARADIDKLPVSDEARRGFRKGFEKSLETSRGRLVEQLTLEAGIVDEVGKLFDLLAAKSGTWAVRGGQLVFADQATLSSFNGHLAEMQKLSARQEALQKQALESTRAKLENLAK
jgi:hypothetical protein